MKLNLSAFKLVKQVVHPKTVLAGVKKFLYFNTINRDMNKWETIYMSGGLVSQAIDAYPLFGMSEGYTLEGPPDKVKETQGWFDMVDGDLLIWQAWVDALIYGDSIQELVFSKKGDLLYVVPRNPKYFTIEVDKWGMTTGYTQRSDNSPVLLKPERVSNLRLISITGESYGQSLIGRSFDDIMRDTRTAESTAVSIERHGFPRYHIKVGSEGDKFSDDEKVAVKSKFQELKPDNEFVTDYNVEILPIDVQGVTKVASYNEWSLSRLLGALGVPSEVIGTGQSTTTYATASVEMVSFLKKVKRQQKRVEKNFNRIIDIHTGIPGEVTLTFNPFDMDGLANVTNNGDGE